MKRKASRPAPYEVPAKLSKRSTSTTVSRKLSILKRTVTSGRSSMPPPKFPSLKNKTSLISRSASLPKPKWPTLVSTGRETDPAAVEMAEISEEPSTRVPGLRRMSTLPLEEEERVETGHEESKTLSKTGSKSMSKTGSKSLSKKGSSLSGVAVATLEKKESVVTLDTSGSVTTITRLASGSSTGEITGLSVAPPAVRKELSKAASTAPNKGGLFKKVSSIRVYGVDAPEEELATSLSRCSSKTQSIRKEASLAPPPSTSSVPLPPGGLIEIVFSFDTTGSMSRCIDEVRGRVGDMIQRLQADIPGIRIAVIAHGDYCDAESFYVIKWIDFGASVPELCHFVQTISGTGGGDFDECYELVLARAQTELSWTPGSQRSLVMIGDATPHPPSYYGDRDEKLDWKEEAAKLAAMDVKIYAVQALNNSNSMSFYQTLARTTRGHHLKLDQFNNIFDMLMVLCYNERGTAFVQAYEDEVRTREGSAGLHKDLEGLFSAIRGGKPSEVATAKVLSKGAAKTKAAKSSKKTPAPKSKAKTLGKSKTSAKTATGSAARGAAKGAAKSAVKRAATSTSKKGAKSAAKRTSKLSGKLAAKAAAKKAKGKGVKSVKGRKPVKTASKKKKKTTKTKRTKRVPGVKKMFREAVKDEELSQGSCLKNVTWSDWFKAIVLKKPTGIYGPDFLSRMVYQTGEIRQGLRNVRLLLDRSDNSPAVYEIAIQLKPKKRYVVFFKACNSWPRKVFWDTVLLNTQTLRKEVNAVVEAGGQIWLRKGDVQSTEHLKEVKRHMYKMYDYAWDQRRVGRGRDRSLRRVRRVKKCNVLISGNSNS